VTEAALMTSSTAAADAAPPSPPAVAVIGLTHRYLARRGENADRPAALDAIDFEVTPGSMFGVLGPNGSGKSTLFRILSTVLRPSDGDARFFDTSLVSQPAAARWQLGVVFQNPSLDAKLTAMENLRYHGRLFGMPRDAIDREAMRWLEELGLVDRRDERVETFSGGMRRRVELAKALLTGPRVLLMDEPSTGLDPGARIDLTSALRKLAESAEVTVLLTTHLMDEAEACDRLVFLHEGRIVGRGTPTELKRSIGGHVVELEPHAAVTAPEIEAIRDSVAERFGPWTERTQPTLVDRTVRVEHDDGPALVAQLAPMLEGKIRRLTVGEPTLDDVFFHLTGRSL